MKIFNTSKKNAAQDKEIDRLVDAPFSFIDRLKMGGIGSPGLLVDEVSSTMNDLWGTDSDIRRCNVEIRPKGLIIRFKSKIEDYAWVIPFHMLSVYQNGKQWSFHSGGMVIKTRPASSSKSNREFMMKLMRVRAELAAEHR